MKTYSVVLSHLDGEQWVEVAESAGFAAMLQLAGLICQYATEEVSAVEVWEADGIGALLVVFSWTPKGVTAIQEEEVFSAARPFGYNHHCTR